MSFNNYSFAASMADKTIFDYWLYLPDDLDANESLPLVLFLHGAGERGPDIERVKANGYPKLFSKSPRNERVIILAPQCQPDRIWNTQVYPLMELVDYVAEKYHADKEKISCTGLSMGGYGTWMMGLTFPKRFSCIAPVCGGGITWMAGALKNTPVRAFHGTADSVVPCYESQNMVDAINKNGGNADITLYEGVGHDSWVNAYEKSDLLQWLMSCRIS